MIVGRLYIDGTKTAAEPLVQLTSGMVGAQVELAFSGSAWAGLTKTAVFRSSCTRDVVVTGTVITIPHEVLAYPRRELTVGVYGTDAEGNLVIPTSMVSLGHIQEGADPSGDPGTDPSLPIWAQINALIGDLGSLNTAAKNTLVAAINEIVSMGGTAGGNGTTFTPHLSADGVLSWTNNGGLPNPQPVSIKGPQGAQGPQGPQGKPGDTPVRGVDYWTDADIAEIKAYVDEAILGGAW